MNQSTQSIPAEEMAKWGWRELTQRILDNTDPPRLFKWCKKPKASAIDGILQRISKTILGEIKRVASTQAFYKASVEPYFPKNLSPSQLKSEASYRAKRLEKAAKDPFVCKVVPLQSELRKAAEWYRSLRFPQRVRLSKNERNRAVAEINRYLMSCLSFTQDPAFHEDKVKAKTHAAICKIISELLPDLSPNVAKTIIYEIN